MSWFEWYFATGQPVFPTYLPRLECRWRNPASWGNVEPVWYIYFLALCFDCLSVMIEGNQNVWSGKLAWSCRACWYQVKVTVHWSLYNSIYELTLLSPPGNYFLNLFICAINELALLNSMLPDACRMCLMLMARTGRNFLLWLKCRVRVKKVSQDCFARWLKQSIHFFFSTLRVKTWLHGAIQSSGLVHGCYLVMYSLTCVWSLAICLHILIYWLRLCLPLWWFCKSTSTLDMVFSWSYIFSGEMTLESNCNLYKIL